MWDDAGIRSASNNQPGPDCEAGPEVERSKMPILKQYDHLRSGTVARQYYNQGSKRWEAPIVYQTGKIIGSGSYNLLHSYGKPRVLPFSLAPVQHRKFLGSSSVGSTILYNQYHVPVYSFTGDLAARIGGHAPNYAAFEEAEDSMRQARFSAHAKLLEPDVGYGLMIAEASETLDLLTSPANFLFKQLKKLRRPRTIKRSAARRLQSLGTYAADAWLQYRYAISPTVSDIQDIVQNTTKALIPTFKFKRAGGGVQGPESYTRTSGVKSLFYGYFTCVTTAGTEYSYVSHLFYDILDYAAAERNRLGIGVSQLPGLLWEKVPFSFVVDWAVDVGSWISAVMPKPEYAEKGETASTIVTRYGGTVVQNGSVYPTLSYSVSPCNSSYVWSETFYDRTLPSPLTGLPPVNASIINLVRSIDSAALSWKPITTFLKSLLK